MINTKYQDCVPVFGLSTQKGGAGIMAQPGVFMGVKTPLLFSVQSEVTETLQCPLVLYCLSAGSTNAALLLLIMYKLFGFYAAFSVKTQMS